MLSFGCTKLCDLVRKLCFGQEYLVWSYRTAFRELVQEMEESDLQFFHSR